MPAGSGNETPMSDSETQPAASQDRGRFQFTLRTLFAVTFVVALFCSAAATFRDTMLFLAVSVLVWMVLAAIYWKVRASLAVAFAHACGPVLGGILVAVSAWRHSAWLYAWEVLLGVGLVASAIVSIQIAYGHRLLMRVMRRQCRPW
jgi:hypothetical protein